MQRVIKFLIKNYHIATILLLAVFVGGSFSVGSLDVMGNANVNFPNIQVSIGYPGAQPQEVVDGVLMKVENAISDVAGIKYYTSEASEGNGELTAYIKDGYNVDDMKDQILQKVDQINDFPKGAEKPEVYKWKSGDSIAYFFFYGDIPRRQLRDLAVDFKNKLKTLPGIPYVEVRGISSPEITVALSEKQLRKYNISIEQISQAIQKNSMNFSAGEIKTDSETFKITVEEKMKNAEEFLNTPLINKDGVVLKLGQIAKIKNILNDSSYEFLVKGQPGVVVKVKKDSDISGNNITIAKTAIDYFNKYKKTLPANVKTTVFDNSEFITDNLDMLVEHGLLGLIFVLIILWLFMGARLSFRIALAVPFSLAGALIVFKIAGMSINITSMFGLLMVTGVVVDFGIVVAESIYVRRSKGDLAEEAAVNGTSYVFLPLFIALICNILAFLPILYLGGMMGKFMRDIPRSVIITLTISFLQAIIILPVYLRNINIDEGGSNTSMFAFPVKTRRLFNGTLSFINEKVYGKIVYVVLKWRYPVISFCIFLFIVLFGMINGGIIKYILMPRGGAQMITADIVVPYGTPFETDKIIAKKLVDGWFKTVEKFNIKNKQDFYKTMLVDVNEGNISAQVFFSDAQNEKFLNKINKYWGEQVGTIPGAEKSTFQIQRNVGMGNQIAVNLYGEDFNSLYKASSSLKQKLEEIEGVKNVYTSYSFGKRAFVIKLKPLAEHLGLNVSQIGSQISNAFYHNEAAKIQKANDEVSVNVSYSKNKSAESVDNLSGMMIKISNGELIPLKDVAYIDIESSPRKISRKNGKSTIFVAADVDQSVANAAEIMSGLKKNYLPKLKSTYDVSFTQEGESKETATLFGSLAVAIPLVLIAMYFVLVLIFKSYFQPFVVLITIPLGILGSFLGLYVMGLSFSMLAIFGMVAMSGIVVNNSIVYVNEVNRYLRRGYGLFASVIEAGKARFRPILLTKMCTFSGLFPLMFISGTVTQLIVPIAVVIAFGVLFTIFVTLLVLPCLIFIFNDIKRLSFYIWFLKVKSREEVESAYVSMKR